MNQRNDTSKSKQFSALLELMQDDNVKVSSLAMERFLKLGNQAEDMVAYYQEETDSPRLRQRMHQLSGILARRKVRASFLDALRLENVDIWDGVMQINRLFNPECNELELEEVIREVAAGLDTSQPNTARLACFFRDQGFTVPEEDTLDSELYLPEGVLVNRCGASVTLCVLAQHIGKLKDWHATIALHEGRFCLVDDHNLVVDPSDGWNLAHPRSASKIRPCGRKDVWLSILSQLFLVALVEGNLRNINVCGDLLTVFDDGKLDDLPYPIGGE